MMSQIRVLILESDPIEANRAQSGLCDSPRNFDFNQLRRIADALPFVKESGCDIIFVNLMLEDSGGVYTVTRLLQANENIPIVVINGPDDESMAQKSLEA